MDFVSIRSLINLYLKPKVRGEKLSCNVIEERQMYASNADPCQVFDPHASNADPCQVFDPHNHPWILFEVSCGKFEKIAYAFVNLTKKAASNNKSHVGREQYIRKAGGGTWDGQTKRTEIRDCDGKLIGERTMLVFEINKVFDQEDLSRVGHWRMHEYHLWGINKDIPNLSNTVLCKIILDHSKKPAIKLLPNKTTRPIKASSPEKNKTKKKNTKKLDVVCSSSAINSAVIETFERISKTNDGLVSVDLYGPKGEKGCWINSIYEPVTNDDDMDWINNIFVEDENLYEFNFPSYPEHEDEQPLGKRKLEAETSYAESSPSQVASAATISVAFMEALGAVFKNFSQNYNPEDTSAFLVSLLFGLGIAWWKSFGCFCSWFPASAHSSYGVGFWHCHRPWCMETIAVTSGNKNGIFPSFIPTCP